MHSMTLRAKKSQKESLVCLMARFFFMLHKLFEFSISAMYYQEENYFPQSNLNSFNVFKSPEISENKHVFT